MLTVDTHSNKDLEWCLDSLHAWNGRYYSLDDHNKPVVQIATDASASGFGGVIIGGKVQTQGFWPKYISEKCSNYREIMAVYMTLLRGAEQTNIGHSNVYLVFCNREQYFDQFKASTRYRKRSSVQTVQTQVPVRMAAASQGFQTIRIQMGTIYGRQVCKSLQRANTYIQQLVPRSNDFRCRCIQSKLGKSQQFHQPSPPPYEQGVRQNSGGQGCGHHFKPGVAGATLVSKTKGDKCEPTTKATKKQIYLHSVEQCQTRTIKNPNWRLLAWRVDGKAI